MKRNTILILALVTLVGSGCVAAFAHSFEVSRNAPARVAKEPAVASEASTSDQTTSTAASTAQGLPASTSEVSVATETTADGKVIIPIRRTSAKPIPDSLGGPRSLSELVASANVVVIGRVTALLDTQIFYGYDEGAAQREAIDKANGSQRLGIPIADYAITLEHIFLSDGKIAQDGDLTLRVVGTPGTDRSLPQLGSRRLFFLSINPDASTYSMPSVKDEIDLTGSSTVYQVKGVDTLPFAMALSPHDFLTRVQQEIAQQTGTLSK